MKDNSVHDTGVVLLVLGTVLALMGVVLQHRRTHSHPSASRMSSDRPGTALVTGASSGIGVAFARLLAAQGYDLILVARREIRLQELAKELQQRYGIRADVLVADLASPDDVERVEERIKEEDNLTLLVNSAGFGLLQLFAESDLSRQLDMIAVHVIASVRLTRAALPRMIARQQGAIVNVSSVGAFLHGPYNVTYCATKAYVNVFSQALQDEIDGMGVRVQALCPGFTRTEFHDSPEYARSAIRSRMPKGFWMTADQVAAASLEALWHGPVVFIPGFKNRLVVGLARSGVLDLVLKLLLARRSRAVNQKELPMPKESMGTPSDVMRERVV